ncbi:MAG: universal stress protein [Bacteroidales bacterium]|jgi:nucleotide-binding universal stress UspA family protein|nr:universal stress protein [Bacteroidales bacterium]
MHLETINQKRPAILVPYDFGLKAQAALNEAITITKQLDGIMYILSVVRKGDFFSELFRKENDNIRIINEVEEKLKEITTKISNENNIEIKVIVEQGSPLEVILSNASTLDAQYIVMGQIESKSSFDLGLFGTSIMQIIALSPCPVMTVSAKNIKQEGFKNIVLPIDITKATFEKINKAILWARYYKAKIHLIGVLSGGVPLNDSRLNLKMQRAGFIIEREGIEYSSYIYPKTDTPLQEVILKHAEENNGDLLMIMTHQELGVRDTYIGAVAQKLLRESPIPVLSFTSKAIEHKTYFVSNFLPLEILSNKDIEQLNN